MLQLITQSRGGPVDHAVDVAIELARLGHHSHLVGPAGGHLDAAAAHGVEVHAADVRSARDVAGARLVARMIARVRPDVLHLQDRRAGLVGRTIANARRTPSVYTLHGVPDELAPLVPGNLEVAPASARDRARYLHLERVLAGLAGRRRSAVVTPCEALAVYARDHVRIPRSRVYAVPNGVGGPWLEAARDARGSAMGPVRGPVRGPAAHAGPVRVVWLGLMQPVKRVPDLVAAIDLVAGVQLDLVGDGPERPRIEAAVAACAEPERVRFVGFRADPSSYLRDADLLALPSAAEACPMVLLQAMASGLPVVATRVGGVPEVVRDGVDGLLVDPGDVDQLARAVRTLAADAALRRRMGDAARARVAQRFGIDRTVASLLDIYAEVAQ